LDFQPPEKNFCQIVDKFVPLYSIPQKMKVLTYVTNIIQLILSPGSGWEDVSGSAVDRTIPTRQYMFRLFGITALTVFAVLFHCADAHFALVFIKAVGVFASLFLTYFLARELFVTFLPGMLDTEYSDVKSEAVISYTLSILSLIMIVFNLLPERLAIYYITPVFVALVFWKSDAYLGVAKDKNWHFILLGIFAVILPPILIQELFDLFI